MPKPTNVRPPRKDWRAHSKRPKQRSGKGRRKSNGFAGATRGLKALASTSAGGMADPMRIAHHYPDSFVIVLGSASRSACASRDAFDVDRFAIPNGSLKPWTLGMIPTCSDRAFPPRAMRTWVGRSARLPHRRSISLVVRPHSSLAEGPTSFCE